MNIYVNGRNIDLPDTEITISELFDSYNIQKRTSVVEHNKEIVSRNDYKNTKVANGDTLEIVHFVGGG
ncbi:sulfur carrier protein ThiS [Halobacillus shinanisalinarum]|uniref:Sulfur carrier protein ThiS n=1 Tax=Halobacillus shinanisalinarum TaxID=2932258 RepID=A0ABY4GUM7_9BACI|nr:sulfur carrier protein ThiS [Halobacillus shinanisalinarum]UOQ91872.1 sulfur carrier protein ThiS [Halobacillus shinanisalinarum]